MKNFSLFVAHVGRVCNDLIPYFYDTEQMIRTIGLDGTEKNVEINKKHAIAVDGVPIDILNDMTVGNYDISMEIGPSYATKREEARDGMTEFMQAFPPAAPLIGDLVAKAQDWPNADEVADRLFHLLPPQLQAEIAQKSNDPSKMPPPPQQPPPDPVAMAKAQAEMAKAQAEQAKAAGVTSEGDFKLKMHELELRGQELKNTTAELQLLDAQMKLNANGPPIDSDKLHAWIGQVDMALKALEHVAS